MSDPYSLHTTRYMSNVLTSVRLCPISIRLSEYPIHVGHRHLIQTKVSVLLSIICRFAYITYVYRYKH